MARLTRSLLAAVGAAATALMPLGTDVTPDGQPASPPSPITATFTAQGLTLTITARCDPQEPRCPFAAEIDGPPALLQSIEGVDYTFAPFRRTSPAPVTDVATRFRFEDRQTFGEKVYAEVTLRPRGTTSARTISIEGAIPFTAHARPPLPAGLRFEDKYWVQFLEGTPSDHHFFRIHLRGDRAARARVRSVEYRLPERYFTSTRHVTRAATEYMVSGSAPSAATFDIVAIIRFTDGSSSTHAIAYRPR